jgi:hypothetical protein
MREIVVNMRKPLFPPEKINFMTNQTNFDALSRKANESGGATEDFNKIFGAAFALFKWHFIARGELPNVNPYIAANADYANGQQMIRAFTDAVRLQRFAKENNLTQADGSTQMLEVPTSGIVDYLEQFIQHGVFGIWFNSDSQSDGFFIPLKQLRPIKEHLAKISAANQTIPQNSAAPMETVAVIINDGLMLPSGFFKASTYACNFYCLVPRDWTENSEMKKDFLESFYERFYGARWRAGNDNGSRYMVDFAFTKVLSGEDLKAADWTMVKNNEKNHYWFYVVENGVIKSAEPQEFQRAFDAAKQTPAANAAAPKSSNAENWGLGVTAEGSPDLRLKFFEPGTINHDVSILPFVAAIQLLVRDYQGAGDFAFIFNFIPEAMQDVSEKMLGNEHGTYLRVRNFKYQAPNNNGEKAEVVTVDSNQMRHVQTGATLQLSFALLKISGQQAAFYYGFEGNRGEVFKLIAAVKPKLDDAGFVAEKK